MNQRLLSRPDHKPHSSAHRVVLLVLAVAGIVLGVLSMHSVNPASVGGSSNGHGVTASAHGHSASSVTATGIPDPPVASDASAHGACGSVCEPELCLALGIACALALTVLSLKARRSLGWLLTPRPLAAARRLLTSAPLRPPSAPSLIALSISRT